MKQVVLDNTHIPLHYQIADYLEDMLKRGELSQEKQVPPEEELAALFGVSRTTIRHSLEHLLNKGLLTRKQGKGTFWTEGASLLRQEKMAGINKQIFNISEKTTVRVLSKSSEEGNDEAHRFLGTPANSSLIVFKRLRSAGGEPMSYTINYLPKHYGQQIEKKHLQRMTMLETLESVVKIELGTIEHEVEITRATVEISQLLGIRVLEPVLTIQTLVFDREKMPVEIVWTHFVENKYKFRVVLD
jgi:GntR family transcriptional regulator